MTKSIVFYMLLGVWVGSLGIVPFVGAQDISYVDKRVTALETYVDAFAGELSGSLENYSQRLHISLEERMRFLSGKLIVLDLQSQAFQKIETNVGTFLLAVEGVNGVDGGVSLNLKIGNYHNADFQDFKLKIYWGTKSEDGDVHREGLTGTEFSFKGTLEKGKWHSITLNFAVTTMEALSYIECEMFVESVELQTNL